MRPVEPLNDPLVSFARTTIELYICCRHKHSMIHLVPTQHVNDLSVADTNDEKF